jgi:type IV pilus assembly protein PilB
LEGRNKAVLHKAISQPNGIILNSGPTGSGKSTTLYSILKELNTVDVNIMTFEDPVEIVVDGINQSQVFPDIGYTFASGLRTALRQDPDIIMV